MNLGRFTHPEKKKVLFILEVPEFSSDLPVTIKCLLSLLGNESPLVILQDRPQAVNVGLVLTLHPLSSTGWVTWQNVSEY